MFNRIAIAALFVLTVPTLFGTSASAQDVTDVVAAVNDVQAAIQAVLTGSDVTDLVTEVNELDAAVQAAVRSGEVDVTAIVRMNDVKQMTRSILATDSVNITDVVTLINALQELQAAVVNG